MLRTIYVAQIVSMVPLFWLTSVHPCTHTLAKRRTQDAINQAIAKTGRSIVHNVKGTGNGGCAIDVVSYLSDKCGQVFECGSESV